MSCGAPTARIAPARSLRPWPVITGHGLKDLAGAMRAVGAPHDIDPALSQVEAIVATRPAT